MIVQELDALRPREQVIADLIMQQWPELMDNLGKHMNGELPLPKELEARVAEEIEAEKECREIYIEASRENISKERLDTVYNAMHCPVEIKIRIMNVCFALAAAAQTRVQRKAMILETAQCLVIEPSIVLADFKDWWDKHHKKKGFPDVQYAEACKQMKWKNK